MHTWRGPMGDNDGRGGNGCAGIARAEQRNDLVEVWLALPVAALLVLGVVIATAQSVGMRSVTAISNAGADDILRAANSCFPGSAWTDDRGAGQLNKRRIVPATSPSPVISVLIEPGPMASHLVTIWLSRGAALLGPHDAVMVRRVQQRVVSMVNLLPPAERELESGR